LQAPRAPAPAGAEGVASLLPPDTYQLTRYDLRSPEDAWRGLGAALSAQVDVSRATFITLALEALVRPYGVERPREFLRACGTELATAKLGAGSEGRLLVASVRDREALGEEVRARLGRGARAERVGDAELLIASDPDDGAAAFAGGYLLVGSEADVRRCLDARAQGRTLRDAAAFKAAGQSFSDEQPFARTLTDEREATSSVLSYFARDAAARPAPDQAALEEALSRRGYGASETRLAEGGFEKRTRSAFGLFGEIITRFSPR
ncbi:MAG TPA: hypothetical protein VE642_04350, partial [Pyrinomonadaceae bacterium]|nr:hypothetical protein [Pyrinomonadaceae bacterium]